MFERYFYVWIGFGGVLFLTGILLLLLGEPLSWLSLAIGFLVVEGSYRMRRRRRRAQSGFGDAN